MKKIRIAILGCNFMGSSHARCYSLIDGVDVVAVADLNEAVAQSVADKFGAKVYTDAEKLINECELDAIDICLPTFLHTKFALLAMEKKIPYIFIEKPVALTREDAATLIEAQKKSGAKIQIGQVLRFWKEYAYLKEVVDSKKYGNVVNAAFNRLSPSPTWSKGNWVRNSKLSGGAIVDLHIHDIDFMLYTFGTPKNYECVKAVRGEPFSYIAAICDYGDFPVTVEGTWNLPPSYPFSSYYRVVFDTAVLEYSGGKLMRFDENGAEEVKITESFNLKSDFSIGNLGDISAHLSELIYFTDCIKENKEIEKATLTDATRSLNFVLDELEK